MGSKKAFPYSCSPVWCGEQFADDRQRRTDTDDGWRAVVHVPYAVGSEERAHLQFEEGAELVFDPDSFDANGAPVDGLFETRVVEDSGVRARDLARGGVGGGRSVRQVHEAHLAECAPTVTQVGAEIEIEVTDRERVARKVDAVPGVRFWNQQLRVGEVGKTVQVEAALLFGLDRVFVGKAV